MHLRPCPTTGPSGPRGRRLGSQGGNAEKQKRLWTGVPRSTIQSELEGQAVPQAGGQRAEGQKGCQSRTEQPGQEESGYLTWLAMSWMEGGGCRGQPGSQCLPEPRGRWRVRSEELPATRVWLREAGQGGPGEGIAGSWLPSCWGGAVLPHGALCSLTQVRTP